MRDDGRVGVVVRHLDAVRRCHLQLHRQFGVVDRHVVSEALDVLVLRLFARELGRVNLVELDSVAACTKALSTAGSWLACAVAAAWDCVNTTSGAAPDSAGSTDGDQSRACLHESLLDKWSTAAVLKQPQYRTRGR